MYKVILVDDEDEVREGIHRKINWKSHGFDLVGDYDNGRDALEAVEDYRPDLVITDICMAFMDGLELTRQLAYKYPEVKVVIITGYEDFEYAKQAISLKVNEYLLKPINAREFAELLEQMRKTFDEEQRQRENLSALRIQVNQSIPLLRERFLERLVSSRIHQHEIKQKMGSYGISLSGPAYLAMVVDVDELEEPHASEPDRELLRFAAFNILQEQVEHAGLGAVFQTRDDKLGAIISGLPLDLEAATQHMAEQIRSSIAKYLKMKITIGIGRACTSLGSISASFQEALSSLDYRLLLGPDKVIFIGDLEHGVGIDQISFHAWEQRLLTAMKTGHVQATAQVLGEWFTDLRHHATSIHTCHSILYQMLVSIMNYVAETGFNQADLFPHEAFTRVTSFKSLEEAQRGIQELTERMMIKLSEQRTSLIQSQMREAEAYIKTHYNDEHFSLQHICSHIYMSASYFSSMFKQHTGETFIEYLTRIRLNKAKELLTITQLKAYDIAERVGYGDPQYFSVIFKRNCGMTPKEYRLHQQGRLMR